MFQAVIVEKEDEIYAVEKSASASISCFGEFEVRNRTGQPIHWPTQKMEELFAYLLCHHGEAMSEWRLVDSIWAITDSEQVKQSLHITINGLIKMVKEHGLAVDIQKQSNGYVLETTSKDYDLLAFQRFDLSLLQRESNHDAIEQLCDRYKGPLLERRNYSWKYPLVKHYGQKYTSLVWHLLQRDMDEQRWQRAERRLYNYLSMYPLHQEMNLTMLLLYARSSQLQKMERHFTWFSSLYQMEKGEELPKEIREWVESYLL
ncbi:AfsR/SARP family transcriptional regulator [Brevibacillus reuszeri]|uniref:AfsR/SARP family transcriptional regulator n=1 Tax=Brevibacillus reuszeri TaxID=54915 RepID=UPI003D1D8074